MASTAASTRPLPSPPSPRSGAGTTVTSSPTRVVTRKPPPSAPEPGAISSRILASTARATPAPFAKGGGPADHEDGVRSLQMQPQRRRPREQLPGDRRPGEKVVHELAAQRLFGAGDGLAGLLVSGAEGRDRVVRGPHDRERRTAERGPAIVPAGSRAFPGASGSSSHTRQVTPR